MSTSVMVMTATLLVLLSLKLPMFAAILGVSAVYFVLTPGINPAVFTQQAITGVESMTLLAIPFLVCAGVLMNYTGVIKRTMDFCVVLTGRMYGGLPQISILLSTLMDGFPGSALVDVVMEAKILALEMGKRGIGRAFSTAVTAVSSTITSLILPGIGLILYGCTANASIDELFVAGFNPGVLLCATMMLIVSRISKKRGYLSLHTEKMHPFTFWKSFRPVALPLCLPIIIIGGAHLGVFTATEVSSVVIAYAAILGIVYRELGFKEIAQSLKETLQTASSIMLIVATVSTFSRILTKKMTPRRFTEWMIQMVNNKRIFPVVVDIFPISIGTFIEGNTSMIALVPLLASTIAAYGIDPIHSAMVFILTSVIGAFTPPMGTLMFVACGVTKCSTRDFTKEAASLYALLSGCLLILTFVSLFSTGLVNLVY